jgi:hypothetical protein
MPFFFSAFLGVFSVRGVQKRHLNVFTKSPCRKRKLFQKNRQKNRCQFSSTFFVLSRFRVFLSDGSSKTLPKTFYKKVVSKTNCKKIDKKIQNRFFLDFFNHVFGRFSVRGVKKHDKKSGKKSDQPWYFFGPRGTNQPRQGPSISFLECPSFIWRHHGPWLINGHCHVVVPPAPHLLISITPISPLEKLLLLLLLAPAPAAAATPTTTAAPASAASASAATPLACSCALDLACSRLGNRLGRTPPWRAPALPPPPRFSPNYTHTRALDHQGPRFLFFLLHNPTCH